jgi:hypothetical protein
LVSHIVLLRVEQSLQLGHVREKKSKWNIPWKITIPATMDT